jgi:predicted cation transporter
LSFLFFFWWYWGLTQGLTLARQALLLLEPLCQPFFVLGIFFLFFLAVLGFELRAFLEPLHQLFFFFFVMGIFEIASQTLFSWGWL